MVQLLGQVLIRHWRQAGKFPILSHKPSGRGVYRSPGASRQARSALAWRRSYRLCSPLTGKAPCRQDQFCRIGLTTYLLKLPAHGSGFCVTCRSQPISCATLVTPLGLALDILQPAVVGPQVIPTHPPFLLWPFQENKSWAMTLTSIYLQVSDLSSDAYSACTAIVECIRSLSEGAGEPHRIASCASWMPG